MFDEYGFIDLNALGVGENVETGVNQDESDMDNHGRYSSHASKQVRELGYAENNNLAAMKNRGTDDSLNRIAYRNPEMETLYADQSGLKITSTILRSRPMILPPTELIVRQELSDMVSIDGALSGMHFKKKIVKSGENYYTAECANEGCPWRIDAARLPGSRNFTFQTVHSEHRCGVVAHPGHQQSSVQRVASSVEQPLRENPYYRPKEIFKEIHRVHGMPLSHEQASRHQEHYMASASGSFEEDYSLLSQYCNKVRQTNPGSLASVCVDPMHTSSFRLFISYQASIFGFLNACRPLIGLERTVLKNKYLLNLLFATSFDGDGAIFPLAFGIVGQENEGDWMWFLSELKNLLEMQPEYRPKLTILSNRQKSITVAVETKFPTAYHRLCMHHVSKSFQELFHDIVLVNLLWKAAIAVSPTEFDTEVLEIEKISRDAARWVRTIPPRLWANSHFKGMCFRHPTISIVESLNAWILEANGLPIVQMMECIHRKLMNLFNERREASMKWTSVLVPSAERQVSQAVECARSYQVFRGNEEEFVVTSQERQLVVDIRQRRCLCQSWQKYGLPCSHAAAVLLCCKQNVYRFAWECFTLATYRKAYSQTIHPILPDILVNPPKSQEQQR